MQRILVYETDSLERIDKTVVNTRKAPVLNTSYTLKYKVLDQPKIYRTNNLELLNASNAVISSFESTTKC